MCGLFNLFSQYGGDYGFMEPTYDDYWKNFLQFLDHSPHMAVEHFKTPLLIGHGLQDRRVPISHPLELFHILQRRGVPSRLICYPDEHHWFLKPQNNVHWNEQMIAWMRKYAGITDTLN
jgi:dipeptidyl aminopeptidase/acylaminoacyl peptidase